MTQERGIAAVTGRVRFHKRDFPIVDPSLKSVSALVVASPAVLRPSVSARVATMVLRLGVRNETKTAAICYRLRGHYSHFDRWDITLCAFFIQQAVR